jgi:vacuolar-type H+-ATPase subunit H
MKKETPLKGNNQKVNVPSHSPHLSAGTPVKQNPAPHLPGASLSKEELTSLKDASAAVHQIKISAQRELELARKMRDDARRYQQETATRARSDAQQLILRTRLETQRETEELIRQASEEIQKVLADIRMIRIMAQEELAAQRKFTDAARLRSMSIEIQHGTEKPEAKRKRQLAEVK